MDHEAYERQMIDTVNRNAAEKNEHVKVVNLESATTRKEDATAFKRGLKRMAIALITAALFALSVFNLIWVATANGYWAVLLFFAALVEMAVSVFLLYCQGIIVGKTTESKGEGK